MNPQTTGQVNPEADIRAYVPPKNWDEITVEEKLERMREIIHSLINTTRSDGRQINRLREQLSKHEHREGKVVVIRAINQYDDELSPGAYPSEANATGKSYF